MLNSFKVNNKENNTWSIEVIAMSLFPTPKTFTTSNLLLLVLTLNNQYSTETMISYIMIPAGINLFKINNENNKNHVWNMFEVNNKYT